ncbi:hypothetical protein Trydic_g5238 [Trypoxylus dichotomus]
MLFFKLLTILSAAFLIYCFEDGKIVGGNDVNIARYPFVVSLNFFGWHICGGSIIGKRSVLTAAHCLQGVYPLYLTIYAGSRYRTLPMQRVPVLSAKIHEKYNRESIENDIAIIWLRFDLVFSRRILPVALPIQDEEVYPNTKAQILGWGRTEGDSGGPLVTSGKLAGIVSSRNFVTGLGKIPMSNLLPIIYSAKKDLIFKRIHTDHVL